MKWEKGKVTYEYHSGSFSINRYMYDFFPTSIDKNAGQGKRWCSEKNEKYRLLVVFGSGNLADNGLLSEIKLFTLKQVMVQ